ncbi:DUF116 domain-containing protein [Oceanidesulfovibrio marinus]|uniref:DUF116 domain-containing protein n=1 Tax=Oceanidesulfovibrio marinus TaxID=370038 RepID=A0A6P1ZK71_9BACT|nr:DUF116 domain-containing protein [Oceanidesulfovibrio marinus]QJT10039.1 DUF116 domain-containing protein [Oceanidesulfovibrio marinus]TVM36121.1 hypothetical protein DQK91_04075 [Oceanidesulfovibrio marinus]
MNQNLHEIQPERVTRKRLFIGLISATSLVVIIVCILLWIVPYVGFRSLHPAAPTIFGVIFCAAILFTLWAWLSLLANIFLGRPVLFSQRMRGLTIKFFLPLMTLLGRLVGISKEDVRNSFIKVNNELVRAENVRYPADRILLLMPHCLQSSRCDMRLTYDIDNCKRCGKCPIKSLLEIRDEFGVHLAIATGGTIARRIVVQARPKLIIAVACERDLSSGIQDTYPIPVYGILNERPNGPCLDTTVQRSAVEAALCLFLQSPPISCCVQSAVADTAAPSSHHAAIQN